MNEKFQKMVAELMTECKEQGIATTFVGTKGDDVKVASCGSVSDLATHLIIAENNLEKEAGMPNEFLRILGTRKIAKKVAEHVQL